MKKAQRAAKATAVTLLIAALLKELRLPRGLRVWRGTIFGVPYNFRPYTSFDELAHTHWNPQGNVIVRQPFGIGWSINLPALLRRLGLRS